MTLTTREKIMASDATEREGEDRNWSCNNGKVERRKERERRRYGERERGDVMLRRLSEMGI